MVDRIGKGGGVPPTATPDVQQKGAVDKPFQVERGESAKPTEGVTNVQAHSPLARLRAGEIDVHGYIDLKVDEATAGLKGLAPEQLDSIKKTLRDQMATDPALVDLVRTATGQTPKPPED
jgi:hypothetical protein